MPPHLEVQSVGRILEAEQSPSPWDTQKPVVLIEQFSFDQPINLLARAFAIQFDFDMMRI